MRIAGRRRLRLFRAVLPRRGTIVLIAMWLLGLSSLGAVLVLQERLDQRRQAQVAVAGLRKQVSDLPRIALDLNHLYTRAQVRDQLIVAEGRLAGAAASLDALSGGAEDSRLIMSRARPVFRILDRINALSSSGDFPAATGVMGRAVSPGGRGYALQGVFDQVGAELDHEATRARSLAEIGSAFAIVVVLLAFSLALHRVTRLAREKHELLEQSREDALTDQLTELGNRRRLFIDMDALLERPHRDETLALGMFDLDGFKEYNDRFGHPAGDALLARLGARLVAAVDRSGTAYRMGGDEFCVIARGPEAETVLERAREALCECGEGFAVRCSLGSVVIAPDEMPLEEALRKADQRLYDDKRSSQGGREPAQPARGAAEPPDRAAGSPVPVAA